MIRTLSREWFLSYSYLKIKEVCGHTSLFFVGFFVALEICIIRSTREGNDITNVGHTCHEEQ